MKRLVRLLLPLAGLFVAVASVHVAERWILPFIAKATARSELPATTNEDNGVTENRPVKPEPVPNNDSDIPPSASASVDARQPEPGVGRFAPSPQPVFVADDVQLFVYLLNRARSDPSQYGRRFELPVDLSDVQPRPPLAINENLFASAQFRADEMAEHNYMAHQSEVTGDWPNQVVREHRYELPTHFDNEANQVESLGAGPAAAARSLSMLIIDEGTDPPGHRFHLLGMGDFYRKSREVGVGHAHSEETLYKHYWAIHVTWNRPGDTFLTGTVFDDINGNAWYDLGEGVGGVEVKVNKERAITNTAGGWSIRASAGDHDVRVSGSKFVGTSACSVRVAGENVEIDFVSGVPQGIVNFGKPSVATKN